MGGTYSACSTPVTKSAYDDLRAKRLASTGYSTFHHTSRIRSGAVPAMATTKLDPAKIKDSVIGKRECRDTDDQPNSNGLAVFFDVTGSMGSIPRVLQEKLVKLMPTLKSKSFIDDPAILFGANGDARCGDRVPLQIGQFENTLEMDENLNEIYLEGGGGGGNHETYELSLFFLSRLTSTDNYEKRGKRGYAFLIVDEKGYEEVSKESVHRVFGADMGLQEDIPIHDICKEVQEKWEVFIIIPTTCGYGLQNKAWWNDKFPQHVLELDDPDLVCELIVTTIGVAEGVIDDAGDLVKDLDLTVADTNVLSTALTEYRGTKGGKELATVTGGVLVGSGVEDGLD